MEKSFNKRVIEKKMSLTPEDFAASRAFASMLDSGVKSCLKTKNVRRRIGLRMRFDQKNDVVAYTDNRMIHVNSGNKMFLFDADENKSKGYTYMKKIMGAVFHEMGHIFYTSFPVMEERHNEFADGKISKGAYKLMDADLKKSADELTNLFKDSSGGAVMVRNFFSQYWHDAYNCVEDGRIERILLNEDRNFSGFAEGLVTLRNFHAASLSTFEFKKPYDISDFVNLVLCYGKFRNVFNYEGGFPEFEKAKPYIDRFIFEDDPETTTDLATCISLCAWPLLRDNVEAMKAAGNDPDRKKLEKALQKALEDALDQYNQNQTSTDSKRTSDAQCSPSGASAGMAPEGAEGSAGSGADPGSGSDSASGNGSSGDQNGEGSGKDDSKSGDDGNGKSGKDGKDGKNSKDGKEKDGENGSSNSSDGSSSKDGKGESGKAGENGIPGDSEDEAAESMLKGTFDKIAKEVADNLVRKDIQKEAAKATESCAENILEKHFGAGRGDIIGNMDSVVCLPKEPDPCADEIIESVNRQAGSKIRRAAREIQRHYEADQFSMTSRNRYYGKKFVPKNLVRRDYRYFESKGVQHDPVKMAVALCIDESGSMGSDNRYTYSRAAAICLYELVDQIPNTDVMITGHTAGWNGIELFPYAEFGHKPKDLIRNLTSISCIGGNVDIVPFQVCGEKLLQNPAEAKLLIMISDGLPNGGLPVEAALCDSAKEFSRKGIEVICAAIGDDRKQVENIYKGQKFLDIEDLSQLPDKLVQVIKRRK